MKKIIFIAVMMLLVIGMKAQDNSQTPQKPKFEYCEIQGNEPFMGKMNITIDYGTSEEKTSYKSMVEAANALSEKGWEIISTHVSAKNNGNNTTFYYVMKRKVE